MYVTLWNLRWTSDPWTLHASLWEKRMSLDSNNMLPLSGLWSLCAQAEHHCCTPRQSASGFALTDFDVSHHFHGPSSSDGTAECALRIPKEHFNSARWAPLSSRLSAGFCMFGPWVELSMARQQGPKGQPQKLSSIMFHQFLFTWPVPTCCPHLGSKALHPSKQLSSEWPEWHNFLMLSRDSNLLRLLRKAGGWPFCTPLRYCQKAAYMDSKRRIEPIGHPPGKCPAHQHASSNKADALIYLEYLGISQDYVLLPSLARAAGASGILRWFLVIKCSLVATTRFRSFFWQSELGLKP